jgi:hypothetical protein
MRPSKERDLLEAARFMRGDSAGADVLVLARVADHLEDEVRKSIQNREKDRAKRKSDREGGHGDEVDEGSAAVADKP